MRAWRHSANEQCVTAAAVAAAPLASRYCCAVPVRTTSDKPNPHCRMCRCVLYAICAVSQWGMLGLGLQRSSSGVRHKELQRRWLTVAGRTTVQCNAHSSRRRLTTHSIQHTHRQVEPAQERSRIVSYCCTLTAAPLPLMRSRLLRCCIINSSHSPLLFTRSCCLLL